MHKSVKDILDSIKGKVIKSIDGAWVGSELMSFTLEDGVKVSFYNQEDARNDVRITIEEIHGDLQDIIGQPIIQSEEVSSESIEESQSHLNDGSGTWTFYKFATNNGSLTFRWLGNSNGYYSEKVYVEITPA